MSLSKISQVLEQFTKDKVVISKNRLGGLLEFGEDNKYIIDIASDFETKIEAYQLMYKLYRNPEMNYASEDSSEMWYSLFNADPKTTTLVVRCLETNKLVATLTIVIDSALGLPLEENYPIQIEEFRKNKRLCAEIISLGFDKDIRGSSEVLIQIFKFAYLVYRGIFNATDLLIMIKPGHAKYYEKKLCFNKIGTITSCHKINNQPVVLYHIDTMLAQDSTEKSLYHEENTNKLNCNAIYRSFVLAQKNESLIKYLEKKIKHSELSILELTYFFLEKKKIFNTTNQVKMNLLSNMYGNENTKRFIRTINLKSPYEFMAV